MNLKIAGVWALTGSLLILTGCVTTIRGPYNYTESESSGKVKSSTISSAVGTAAKLQPTFEDEYVSDAAGNIVKHKQTEYFNLDNAHPDFVVWETDFKVVGGVLLPTKQSVNGVDYVEIEYDVLSGPFKGPVKQDTVNRRFNTEKQIGFDKYYTEWAPELSRFPVDFRADDKFVTTQNKFYPYRGYVEENVLTLGYDNIVLKHYSYSHTKLVQGFNKSFQWSLFSSGNTYRPQDNEFAYTWKVIGNALVQTNMVFTEKDALYDLRFEMNATYNDSGLRTNEVWTAQDQAGKPVTIFQQDLKY